MVDIARINTGTLANDGTGDATRAAWTKANANFDALKGGVEAAIAGSTAVAQTIGSVTALLAGPTPAGFPPRRGQFLAALEASGAGRTSAVYAVVPSDPGDPLNRAWFHTVYVTPTCRLALLVRDTLGLADLDIVALVDAARALVE